MPATHQRSRVSNSVVAKELGLDVPTVSRIRSGVRKPSIPMIARIRNSYGWQPNEQVVAWEGNVYAAEFEKMLEHYYYGGGKRGPRTYGS